MKKLFLALLLLLTLSTATAYAEIKTITESAEYTMGDEETKSVASQRVIQVARHKASEKINIFV